jgi:thiol-disulfide isomerase/thioredoxin/outer membrane lipoprotein-sorting protein
MKPATLPTLVMLLLLTLFRPYICKAAGEADIIQKVSDRLLSLNSVRYHYHREMNYFSDNYHSTAQADCYLEFQGREVKRFALTSENALQVFNGSEYFSLNKKESTYDLVRQPQQRLFTNFSYFYNSIPSFRSMLQLIIADDSISKTVSDTLINNQKYPLIGLAMQNKQIDYLGNYMHFTKSVTIYYKIVVDKKTLLPIQIIQRNSLNPADYTRVTYSAIQTSPQSPAIREWQLATYTPAYRPKKAEERIALIKVGTKLPAWQLPEFQEKEIKVFKSSSSSRKFVLIDFWIKNCGYCMQSFAHLKELQKKYNQQVEILSINAFDPVSDVAFFYKRERPGYKMLFNGRELAQRLGVESNGYPTVLIADDTGKLIYAGYFEREKIERLLDNSTKR